jgi:hypothetical protein
MMYRLTRARMSAMPYTTRSAFAAKRIRGSLVASIGAIAASGLVFVAFLNAYCSWPNGKFRLRVAALNKCDGIGRSLGADSERGLARLGS